MDFWDTTVYKISTVTSDLRDRVGDRALYLRDLLDWNSSNATPVVTVQGGQVVAAEKFLELCSSSTPTHSSIEWDWIQALDRPKTEHLRLSLSVAWNDRTDIAPWEELLPSCICNNSDDDIKQTVLNLWKIISSNQWKLLWKSLSTSPTTLPIALIVQPHSPGTHLTGWITQYLQSPISSTTLLKPQIDDWYVRGDRLSADQYDRLNAWVSQLPNLWGMDITLQWSLDPENQLWIIAVILGNPLIQEDATHRKCELQQLTPGKTSPTAHRIVGIAQVIDRLPHQPLGHNTIAVVKELDPAWISHFHHVCGIIIEQPGLNQHGVILARELGIPIMLGIQNATQDIQTGDRIVMHNDAATPNIQTLDPTLPRKIPLRVNLSQISRLGDILPHITSHEIDGLGVIRSEWLLLPEVATAQDLENTVLWQDLLRSRLASLMQQCHQARRPADSQPPDLYYRCLPHIDSTINPLKTELSVLREMQDFHPHRLRLILPFVQTLEDFIGHHQELDRHDLDPSTEVWMMAEVPAVVYVLDEFIEAGVQGIVIGLNDLTAWTLGIDRTSPIFSASMESPHRALIHAVQHIQRTTERYGIPCWLALSYWSEAWVEVAMSIGITGLMVERSDWQRIAIALTLPDTSSSKISLTSKPSKVLRKVLQAQNKEGPDIHRA